MPNYWIAIMSAAFVVALAAWLGLVFHADSHPVGKPHESLPHREVIGGSFDARDGGRQVMPDPREDAEPPNERDQTGDLVEPSHRS